VTDTPHDEGERPKRLTLSQIVELLLTRSSDRSVVTLTRTATGVTQIEVQVRTSDDVATVEDAEAKAREVYDRLREQYPNAEHEQATVELTRNAKGETQIEVQAKTSAELPTLEAAQDKAGDVFKRLRMRFPIADGTHGAGPINDPEGEAS